MQSRRFDIFFGPQLHVPVDFAGSFQQSFRVGQLGSSIEAQGDPVLCGHDYANRVGILRPESVADDLRRTIDLLFNLGEKIERQRPCFQGQ